MDGEILLLNLWHYIEDDVAWPCAEPDIMVVMHAENTVIKDMSEDFVLYIFLY